MYISFSPVFLLFLVFLVSIDVSAPAYVVTMTEAILPSPPTSPNGISAGKRVSFGNDAVRTFVYEKDSEEATPIIQRQSFTDPDAPKSLVTVTTDTVRPESPSAIFPPTQLEEVRRVTISPPLPSKKMADNENPFRPEEILYHEVDPIVEQYMHKPFPPSRPGSAQTTPIKRVDSPKDNSPAYYQNGLSKEQLLQSEKAADNYENHNNHHNSDNNHTSPPAEEEFQDDLPPAGKVELVHVKRKKCGCCTVQ